MDIANADELVAYCTDSQAQAIAPNNGRVVTLAGKTWIIEYNYWTQNDGGNRHQIKLYPSQPTHADRASSDAQLAIESLNFKHPLEAN